MVESPGQIGSMLRLAREGAGLVVDDVVFRTRLPKSVIVALEAEDFSFFASPVYAKSFLAQYSEFLNVDARAWLDALEPGAFASSGSLRALLDAPPAEAPAPPAEVGARGGWLAFIGLLSLSMALVYGVMASYKFLDSRFAKEAPAGSNPVSQPAVPPAAADQPSAPEFSLQNREGEAGQSPPRAIIVR